MDAELAVLPPNEQLLVCLGHADDTKIDVFIIEGNEFGRTIPWNVLILSQNDNIALKSTYRAE